MLGPGRTGHHGGSLYFFIGVRGLPEVPADYWCLCPTSDTLYLLIVLLVDTAWYGLYSFNVFSPTVELGESHIRYLPLAICHFAEDGNGMKWIVTKMIACIIIFWILFESDTKAILKNARTWHKTRGFVREMMALD